MKSKLYFWTSSLYLLASGAAAYHITQAPNTGEMWWDTAFSIAAFVMGCVLTICFFVYNAPEPKSRY